MLLMIAAGCVGTRILARSSERAADKAWVEMGLSTDGFAAQHPKTITSSAAHRIEEQAARLGIDLNGWAVAPEQTGPQPSEGERKAFSAIRGALLEHIEMLSPSV